MQGYEVRVSGASGITQGVKALDAQAGGLRFGPWNPHKGRRREPTPWLSSGLQMCTFACACPQAHYTHVYTVITFKH